MSNSSAFIYAIIGTEVLSLIICLVLLLGSIMDGRKKSKRTRWFIFFLFSEMTGCLCDLISWVLDGHPEMNSLLFLTTLGSMLFTIILVGLFISYLSAYVNERKKISNVPEIVGWIVVAFGAIALIIAGFTGQLFTFENGHFSEKPLYSVYVVANVSYVIFGIVIITIYRKVLDLSDKLASYAYTLIPMASGLVGLWIEDWDFSYPAITVSLLILYIMIQSDRKKILEKEGTAASYQATHDQLTGLYNRNAYQNQLCLLEGKEENCGVIFGDLNGLKYTNDTYGHEAGDRLLIHYAHILEDMFRMNEIYRISGDEFICIMENVPKDVFLKRTGELKNILYRESPPLACIGASYGNSRDIETIVRDAEIKMYAEKKIVHERYPKTRRVNDQILV